MPWTETSPTSGSWSEENEEFGSYDEECTIRGSSAVVGYAVVGCAIVGTDLAQTWGKESEVTG